MTAQPIRSRLVNSRWIFRSPAELRWRLLATALVLGYLAQYLLGLRWEWLHELQSVDEYKYATGLCLIAYIGWQWYVLLVRLRKIRVRNLLAFHQRSGVFAPVIFYMHSVQIGYGYLALLGWVFLAGILVGLANPVGIRPHNRIYTDGWVALHVALAVLTLVLGLYHGYIAFYYK